MSFSLGILKYFSFEEAVILLIVSFPLGKMKIMWKLIHWDCFHPEIELPNENDIHQHRSYVAAANRFSLASLQAGVALEIIHPEKSCLKPKVAWSQREIKVFN